MMRTKTIKTNKSMKKKKRNREKLIKKSYLKKLRMS